MSDFNGLELGINLTNGFYFRVFSVNMGKYKSFRNDMRNEHMPNILLEHQE